MKLRPRRIAGRVVDRKLSNIPLPALPNPFPCPTQPFKTVSYAGYLYMPCSDFFRIVKSCPLRKGQMSSVHVILIRLEFHNHLGLVRIFLFLGNNFQPKQHCRRIEYLRLTVLQSTIKYTVTKCIFFEKLNVSLVLPLWCTF